MNKKLTVKDLIKILEEYDPDLPVACSGEWGTYILDREDIQQCTTHVRNKSGDYDDVNLVLIV